MSLSISVNKFDFINSILLSTLLLIAFFFPTSSAISDMSTEVKLALSKYFAKLTVMAPEPVPISKISISPLFLPISITSSTKISVSGLGINTPS